MALGHDEAIAVLKALGWPDAAIKTLETGKFKPVWLLAGLAIVHKDSGEQVGKIPHVVIHAPAHDVYLKMVAFEPGKKQQVLLKPNFKPGSAAFGVAKAPNPDQGTYAFHAKEGDNVSHTTTAGDVLKDQIAAALSEQSDPEQKAAPAPQAAPVDETMEDKAKHGAKLPKTVLHDASELYQPVPGTTEGSTYYVVAHAAGLALAARCKNASTWSFRFEGWRLDKDAKARARLESAGFLTTGMSKASHRYYSLHVEADQLRAELLFGALLQLAGIQWSETAKLLLIPGVQK
jgi:hypothetical protein